MMICATIRITFPNCSVLFCSVADSLAYMTLIQPPVACGTASPATNPIHYPVPDAPLFARIFIQSTFSSVFYLLSLTVRRSCSPVSSSHRNQIRMYVCMSTEPFPCRIDVDTGVDTLVGK